MSVSALRKSTAGVLLAASLGLSACSVGSLFKPEESKTYDLVAPAELQKVGRSRAQVSVPEPTALRWLDSDRMVVKPNEAEINYFGEVQWSDRLPRLVQARLIEALERAGAFRAVTKPGSGIDVDYQLITDIRRFEVVAGEKPRAEISLSVKMVPSRSGRSVKQRVFEASAPVSAVDAANASQVLNGLLGDVLKDVVRWAVGR